MEGLYGGLRKRYYGGFVRSSARFSCSILCYKKRAKTSKVFLGARSVTILRHVCQIGTDILRRRGTMLQKCYMKNEHRFCLHRWRSLCVNVVDLIASILVTTATRGPAR